MTDDPFQPAAVTPSPTSAQRQDVIFVAWFVAGTLFVLLMLAIVSWFIYPHLNKTEAFRRFLQDILAHGYQIIIVICSVGLPLFFCGVWLDLRTRRKSRQDSP